MFIVILLRKHGFSFLLSPLPTSNPARQELDTRCFRDVLSSSVLATDMSLHFAWIQNLKTFGATLSSADSGCRESPEEEAADRIMLCQALVKCADISNPVSIPLP